MNDLRRLTADLQRSRERLVLTREEERRRLRRDLHDDLAPTLAGLALTANTIADLIPTDPVKATALTNDLNQSMFQDDGSVFAAMRAGARGYILKDATKLEAGMGQADKPS